MQVALIQTGLDVALRTKAANLAQVLDLIRATDAELLVFPEMWPCGYASFERYLDDAESLEGPLVQSLCAAARNKGCWLVPGSFPEKHDGHLYNTTLLISPAGEIKGVYRKIHVFSYQSQEKKLVSAGSTPTIVATPFGNVGLAVCYDLRFPELFRYYAKNGVTMFIVPASWPSVRQQAWQLFATARAHENMCWMLACNSHADSLVIAPTGEVIARGMARPEAVTANIDLGLVERTRKDFSVLDDAHWFF